MSRKRYKFAGVVMGAALAFNFASAEMSGALAQAIDLENVIERPVKETQEIPAEASSEAETTAEVTPIFVANEVVQPVPENAAPEMVERASSLRELVERTTVANELSEQMRCLAGAVYFESRGEPLAGQLAVAQVVINRTESSRFPNSYCSVVYQRAQFSFVRGGTMPRIKTGSTAWKRAKKIAAIAHNSAWESEARDALYFHASYVNPSWAKKKTARARIKTHIFYR